MGRYCNESDIVPSLVGAIPMAQLTQDDPDATTTDTDVLDQLVEDAEAEVDSYLGYRFDLPLPSVPVLVARLSARITRYRLYTSRGGAPEQWLTDDYNAALKTLEAIRDGKVSLGLTSAAADPGASPSSGKAVQTSSSAPVFGRDNMDDY